jgi:hypothetical protein
MILAPSHDFAQSKTLANAARGFCSRHFHLDSCAPALWLKPLSFFRACKAQAMVISLRRCDRGFGRQSLGHHAVWRHSPLQRLHRLGRAYEISSPAPSTNAFREVRISLGHSGLARPISDCASEHLVGRAPARLIAHFRLRPASPIISGISMRRVLMNPFAGADVGSLRGKTSETARAAGHRA